MSDLLDEINGRLDAHCLVTSRLTKEGCRILLTGVATPHLIIDFDKPNSPISSINQRCDYLLVVETANQKHWVAPLELMKGKLHADKVVRQLKAGARAAERLVDARYSVDFRPIAATGQKSKFERLKLKRRENLIQFHGHREAVRLMNCGAVLNNVLRD